MRRRVAWVLFAGLSVLACSSSQQNGPGEVSTGGKADATGGASNSGGNQPGVSGGNSANAGGSSSGGATSGGATTGGVASGGTATGGTATGGTATGGTATGGTATGGTATGGTATGGTARGGSSGGGSGGTATGGTTSSTGGVAIASGGRPSGGTATGGTATGGTATGGTATGGTATGGTATGGSAPVDCQNFSFFITSMAALIRLSGNTLGFGGDLRYGAADGLAGADKICTEIAATSLPCAGAKTWRAFLATTSVDPIDRIGQGPWYDREGRLVWNNTTEMAQNRPPSAPAAIRDDLPNEDGVPNHDYDLDGSTTDDDNHDVLTGCGTNGRKVSGGTAASRCNDWTSAVGSTGRPMAGHAWPRGTSAANWVSSHTVPGCAPAINMGSSNSCSNGLAGVGCAGGYGSFYCFAMTP